MHRGHSKWLWGWTKSFYNIHNKDHVNPKVQLMYFSWYSNVCSWELRARNGDIDSGQPRPGGSPLKSVLHRVRIDQLDLTITERLGMKNGIGHHQVMLLIVRGETVKQRKVKKSVGHAHTQTPFAGAEPKSKLKVKIKQWVNREKVPEPHTLSPTFQLQRAGRTNVFDLIRCSILVIFI